MARSLKASLPTLSRVLGEGVDTLYERQRALVREKLLKPLPGRGRGSGVIATADAIATLTVSFLTTNSLSEAGPITRVIANAASGVPCPLTNEKTFRAALAVILANEALAHRASGLRVFPEGRVATIFYDAAPVGPPPGSPDYEPAPPAKESVFKGQLPKSISAIHRSASMPGVNLHELAAATREILED